MTTTALEKVSEQIAFGGRQIRFKHRSAVLNCDMQFSVYLPPQAEHEAVPAVYWLSGLTCTDENFSSKAGAQRVAAELGLALIIPDTSPRGDDVPDDDEGAYDFGHGAGFYVNATQQPWAKHYQMYDYIAKELPGLVEAELPLTQDRAISGHSMGGHGALVIGLRESLFSSISAFSPICHPTECPWGHKAFGNYLGEDKSTWRAYDASLLLQERDSVPPILVDQGTADNFLAEQLLTPALEKANQLSGGGAQIRYQQGYDHSYYFIASFIEEHLRFHARNLR
ncbi:S-formylglutathione hydrolase [Aliidiomarina maris]|uniref:S-formylglutathione hydrolase n=1 Tax=Aliidiomarina maris TaxID=531312 RepID=A0A327X086_9GAMM|nr:S-formylglutathione hydrolase [Aliidiomarina maris]MBA3987673.1 S-formylglutathione hydrolase [Idiomarina sp.]MCL5049973.1 S-formylglutathione hydrolase [Bacillota bacterium]RAJ98386.1 S-formylglutathione hydrolase [Aliidiomarina maris]RUO24798.1 S-formylglutathione hydrolase [Aliidiomarina maris]